MTNDSTSSIVSKVWNYAHVLKNAGVGFRTIKLKRIDSDYFEES